MKKLNLNSILTLALAVSFLGACENHSGSNLKNRANTDVEPKSEPSKPKVQSEIPVYDLSRPCSDDQYALLSSDGSYAIVSIDSSRLLMNLGDEMANLGRATMREGFVTVIRVEAEKISATSYSSRLTRKRDLLFYADKMLSAVKDDSFHVQLTAEYGAEQSSYSQKLNKVPAAKAPLLAGFCSDVAKWGPYLPLVSQRLESITGEVIMTSLYSTSRDDINQHVGLKINEDSTFSFLYEKYMDHSVATHELSQFINGKVIIKQGALVLEGLGEVRLENNSYVLALTKPILVNKPNSEAPYSIALAEKFELRLDTIGRSNMVSSRLINSLIAPLFSAKTETEAK